MKEEEEGKEEEEEKGVYELKEEKGVPVSTPNAVMFFLQHVYLIV